LQNFNAVDVRVLFFQLMEELSVLVQVKGKRVAAEFANLGVHGQVVVHFQIETSPELFLGRLRVVKNSIAILELGKIIVLFKLRYSIGRLLALSLDHRVAFLSEGFLLQ
jgi:hypothetical protein